MRRKKIFLILSMFFIFLGFHLAAYTTIQAPTSNEHSFNVSYTVSDAIEIISNSDFISQGWPGTGTPEDPFIIENLQIESDRICISISGTTDHFIIKDCSLDSEDLGNGITLSNVQTAVIENNRISRSFNGISLIATSNVTIKNNTVSHSVNAGASIAGWGNKNLTVDANEVHSSDFWVSAFLFVSLDVARFTNNIIPDNRGHGFEISQGHDIIISNNTLVGPAYYADAIRLEEIINCTVDLNRISGFETGISLKGCDSLFVFNNRLENHTREGIYSSLSSSVLLEANTIENSYKGIGLFGTQSSSIIDNKLIDNEIGIHISDYTILGDNSLRQPSDNRIPTTNCKFINNELLNNSFVFTSVHLDGWIHDFSNNVIDGEAFGYFQNIANTTVDAFQFGQLVVVNSNHISIVGGSIEDVGFGMSIAFCIDVTVSHLSVKRALIGFYVFSSLSIQITDCIIADNALGESLLELQYGGLVIENTESCSVSNSTITYSENGILLLNSKYCSITNISILYNQVGISVSSLDDSIISYNTVSENLVIGILIDSESVNIRIYGNTISSNLRNALCFSRTIYWDDGTSIGNDWSDFNGESIYEITPYGRDNFPNQVLNTTTSQTEGLVINESLTILSLAASFLAIVSLIAIRDFRTNH
ncbi:MAG: right-handed parallel beta-helix repeat-containing protein [Candidatus Thorarchaeota archaeon]